VLESPATEDELREHCRAHLARFKVPKSFHVVDELPRNSIGKIQKSELFPSGSVEPTPGVTA